MNSLLLRIKWHIRNLLTITYFHISIKDYMIKGVLCCDMYMDSLSVLFKTKYYYKDNDSTVIQVVKVV